MLGLLWLAGATYAGYLLTERSFSFLHEVNAGESGFVLDALPFDPDELAEKLPASSKDVAAWYEAQPADIKLCLRLALGEEKIEAAMAGENIRPSPGEVLAVTKCLK